MSCCAVLNCFSGVQLFATLYTAAHQALLSMEFSRQEYWNGMPFPSPGDLPDPGIEAWFPALQADSLLSELPGKPHYAWKDNHVGRQASHDWDLVCVTGHPLPCVLLGAHTRRKLHFFFPREPVPPLPVHPGEPKVITSIQIYWVSAIATLKSTSLEFRGV